MVSRASSRADGLDTVALACTPAAEKQRSAGYLLSSVGPPAAAGREEVIALSPGAPASGAESEDCGWVCETHPNRPFQGSGGQAMRISPTGGSDAHSGFGDFGDRDGLGRVSLSQT